MPRDKRISHDLLIAPGATGGAPGQVVIVRAHRAAGAARAAVGRVVEVLGDYADPGMEIEIALRKHELPFEFSPKASASRALPKASA